LKQHLKFIAISLIIFSLTIGIYAQNKKNLINELTAYKVSVVNNKETFEKLNRVKSGDIIEYRISLTNNSKEELKNIKPTIPVPDGTFFLDGYVNPSKIYVSLDGKSFKLAPLYENKKLVDPVFYKFIKWNIDSLKVGEKVILKMRVKVK